MEKDAICLLFSVFREELRTWSRCNVEVRCKAQRRLGPLFGKRFCKRGTHSCWGRKRKQDSDSGDGWLYALRELNMDISRLELLISSGSLDIIEESSDFLEPGLEFLMPSHWYRPES
jgi:hypothetical protein